MSAAFLGRLACSAITFCFLLVLLPAQGQDRPPDTIGQRLQACTACHGKEGVASASEYFPRIAGKPAGYLLNQLHNFRDGHRNNVTMAYFVANMSDAYLSEIANYFAALDLPYWQPVAMPTDQAVVSRGKSLVELGDTARGIPACIECHGKALTGTLPSIPGLVGQRREYLLAQFGGWRSGQRKAAEPDCMRTISRGLSIAELDAIADYLSRQPVPASSSAVPAVRPLPIDCGSAGR